MKKTFFEYDLLIKIKVGPAGVADYVNCQRLSSNYAMKKYT